MNWDSDELRAAALKLLLLATLRETKVAAPLLAELEELGMVAPGTRKGEFRLLAQQEDKFRRYLSVRWPEFAETEQAFSARPTLISAIALRALRRAPLKLPAGITQLNRKTWSAWAGAHSKSGCATPPPGILLTSDENLRLRPNAGLQIIGEQGGTLDADVCRALFGELIVPERGFSRNWHVTGVLPWLVLTVENIGAYIDITIPPWLLLVHAPGRNTLLATRFIDRLPATVPWVHFGDLDPAGLDIALSMRGPQTGRTPVPWIPHIAFELLETHSLPLSSPWPTQHLPQKLLEHPVLAWLIAHQRWLEHESIVVLSGLVEDVTKLAEMLRER
ncbi:hypothetical protein KY495_20225 [Massilia sp. PAMC28688]|uniref:hypothetical protein n=1 Tax=Massilia sp. PAMC28688 TaxID=2861283 RepID=UPI001C6391FC|nr:hypothetical protein [Massilia sp. PAMC28688]QYF93008.1 hypothetical protein KY495_20225 [Massilia sp. PAMC28688]